MNYPRKAKAVIRAHDELILAFMDSGKKRSTLAKYYFLKLKFRNSWLYNDVSGATERLGVDDRTVKEWLKELIEAGLASRHKKGYRLASIRKIEEAYVPARRRKHLHYSRTLCIVGDVESWKEVEDLLYLKLVERHARRTYFQARHDGNLNDVIERIDQRTKRYDGSAKCGIRNGESLAILITLESVMRVLNVSKNTASAWRDRMKGRGYIKSDTSYQVVTEVIGPGGRVPIGKMNRRQFEAFKEENPQLIKGHYFLGKNGQVIRKIPTRWEFIDFPVYHTEPKRRKRRFRSLVPKGLD
jgi:hypothetical protein